VEVRVLGPIDVVGACRPFRRAWSLDLVVYLATHRHGATTGVWTTALWPDRVMAPATVHSTASAARRALGRSTGGGDHLPRRHGRLQLAPSVGTDWARFGALAGRGDPPAWREALRLVRGRPFDGLGDADWPVLEGLVARATEDVVSVALAAGEHDLASGDGAGASRAARIGLVASPYDERLFRLLLRAGDAQGNPAGVEATMRELVGLLADGTPTGATASSGRPGTLQRWEHWVHPETAALYRRLMQRLQENG
jgi:hypothetical protein